MEEEGVLRMQKKHVYIVVVAMVLFSAGFAAKSLANYYSASGNEDVICSSPGNCEKPSSAVKSESPQGLWDPFGDAIGSKEEMGNRVLAYVNEEFLKPQGAEGGIVDVKEYGDSLYLVNLRIQKDGVAQQTSIYVTKDGKLIMLGEGGGMVDLPKTDESAPLTTVTPQEPASSQLTPKGEIDISDAAYVAGPKNSTVTMIEFNDFQCPFCKRFRDQTLDLILENYGARIQYVLMDFPITSIHPQALITHIAARCAGDQGKYFEYHDKIFTNQQVWSRFVPESEDEINELKKYAEDLDMDKALFGQCLDSKKYGEDVLNNMQKGLNAGVTGTPAFFINGQKVSGAQPYTVFQQILEAELVENLEPDI